MIDIISSICMYMFITLSTAKYVYIEDEGRCITSLAHRNVHIDVSVHIRLSIHSLIRSKNAAV